MKLLRKTLIAGLIAATLGSYGGFAFADTPTTPGDTPPAKCPAPATPDPNAKTPAIPDVTYPYTFVCAHCGIKITVKTKDDWLKPCPVCPCSTTTLACLPKAKKKS